MSFKDYYHYLQERPNILRKEIIQRLGISEKAFYNKFNNDRFTKAEKFVIADVMEKPLEDLFPEKKDSEA